MSLAAGGVTSTIAALATPPGKSGVALIRVSGNGVSSQLDSLFVPRKSFPHLSQMKPYTVALGKLVDDRQQPVDQVLVTFFQAPHSYTGEDVVEITCHGSQSVVESILEALYASGVQPATAGEFTKRAYLNGKMDLVQAEAVMDLIDSEGRLQQKTALAELEGELSQGFQSLSQRLLNLQSQVELIIEFPEHEETPEALNQLSLEVTNLQKSIRQVLDSWSQGRLLKEGLRVSIGGLPNAGKSSLFNALAGENKAIVTEIPGTTRDVLEVSLLLGGLRVLLKDTAGLRQSADLIEQEGIQRAQKALLQSDLIFWLVEPGTAPASISLLREMDIPREQPVILVAGKQDLAEGSPLLKELQQLCPDYSVLPWSSQDADRLKELKQRILDYYHQQGAPMAQGLLIHNARHQQVLVKAEEALHLAASALEDRMGLDLVAAMLRSAQEQFYELTGKSVSESLVDCIFSRFCVGK